MIILVSGATKTVEKYKKNGGLGQLLTPDTRNSVKRILNNNLIWACDNSCFKGFEPVKFLNMLSKINITTNLKFVSMPDIVCDPKGTRELFDLWHPIVKKHYPNLPLAYVLQDGVKENEIPWDDIAAIFIGGSTAWKIGEEVRELIKIAKSKNKWVHMGRVNTIKRLKIAQAYGVDSVDGSGFSMFAETYIPQGQLIVNQLMVEDVFNE